MKSKKIANNLISFLQSCYNHITLSESYWKNESGESQVEFGELENHKVNTTILHNHSSVD